MEWWSTADTSLVAVDRRPPLSRRSTTRWTEPGKSSARSRTVRKELRVSLMWPLDSDLYRPITTMRGQTR